MHRNHLVDFYPWEETLLPMIEEYLPMDGSHDNFYQKFMEQRTEKSNNFQQPNKEDSLPTLIEPLRTVLVTCPQKRVSHPSSDSGVNSPHSLSPAMPITPDITRPYLIPSTSRTNSTSGPLTSLRQFNGNSHNFEKKEPKNIRPSPIILIPSLCFVLALDKAISSKFSTFIWFLSFFTHIIFRSLELNSFLWNLQFFILFQITA